MAILSITLLSLVLAYLALVLIANRKMIPRAKPLTITRSSHISRASRQIRLLSWNVGYAGLGEESDFVADGGSHLRAPSAEIVDKNLSGIHTALRETAADVYVLQECTLTSPLNYWRPVWDSIKDIYPAADSVWQTDLDLKMVPWPLRLKHGMATIARVKISTAHSVPLPLERNYWLGIMKKQYALLVTRIAIEGAEHELVIANVHLAAFDDAAATRSAQLEAVLEYAKREYNMGNYVVIAGDWNLALSVDTFPHRTPERFLNWLHPFPLNCISQGWQMAFDTKTPSVRTLHKPYEPGVNFTAVVDAVLVSPNIGVLDVEVLDYRFAFSDHQPVLATLFAEH